jgi:hypothetical protein
VERGLLGTCPGQEWCMKEILHCGTWFCFSAGLISSTTLYSPEKKNLEEKRFKKITNYY